jgi:hypothetical protein
VVGVMCCGHGELENFLRQGSHATGLAELTRFGTGLGGLEIALGNGRVIGTAGTMERAHLEGRASAPAREKLHG